MTNTISHPVVATTQRLKLRPLEVADADTLYKYRNQPEVMQFQGWTPENPEEVADYARAMASRPIAAEGEWYQVILEVLPGNPNENKVIGDVAFCIDPETSQQAELGIALDTQYQKHGYAQEAIKALVGYLFERHQLHRIHVSIDSANRASRNLFERVGFRFEGHLKKAVWFKGQWTDDVVMALLNEEWQQGR